MKSSKEFQLAYSKLNKNQKLAVDEIDGPVMVVAGPGTGKTQTVTLRIANILLKTDTEPDAILALTFTDSGARAMRKRLESFIGHTSYYVEISTFHSFCVGVIRDNPEFFTINPSNEPISELEKLKTFHSILDNNNYKFIKPVNSPYHYVKALIKSIQDLKREGISFKEFSLVLEEEKEFLQNAASEELSKTTLSKRSRDLSKNLELLDVYEKYQAELSFQKTYDFEDMINLVADELETNKELLLHYQERFQYFLVDEYQDTNSAQNKVINLLASYWGEKANIFVVGDPDQSIMRFQGASLENFLSFSNAYPSAKIITLTDNYRSTQTILNCAHSIIKNNSLRIDDVVDIKDPLLVAHRKVSKKIQVSELPTQLSEAFYITLEIKKIIKDGSSPSEIAVIYRNNSDAKDIIDVLIKEKINYLTQGGGDILEDKTVQKLLKIFSVIHDLKNKEDDLGLFTILHYDIFSINPLDVLKISRAASERKLTLFDIIENEEILNNLSLSSIEQIKNTLRLLVSWQKIDANSTFIEFFESVINESGFLNWVLSSPDAHNKLARINTLFTEVKKMNQKDHNLNLEGFLENLFVMQQNNLTIKEQHISPHKDAVTLTTAHSAKGLEWKHVFIYQAYDKKWGNNRAHSLINLPTSLLPMSDLSKKEKNEDERRLFYVALTRAKLTCCITYANTYNSYSNQKEVIPSMFISEIDDEYIDYARDNHIKDEEALKSLLAQSSHQSNKKDEDVYLKELIDKFKLSVTSLNTYLECPYKFKLNNLLKVPRAKASYLAFGTAIHKAFELFFRKFQVDSLYPNKAFLINSFKEELAKEIMTKKDYESRLEQGRTILSAYFDFFSDDFVEPLFVEKFSRVYLEDIPLTGKIDVVVWEDRSDKTIKVIDFKTGKPKTKGQILGTTKDSNGNLYRQLAFYNLLIDLDRRLQVKFAKAELDFVQSPAEKNKSGKNTFTISQDQLNELKKTIHEVMGSIRSLSFPRTSDYSVCTRCEFKDHCWPDGIPNI